MRAISTVIFFISLFSLPARGLSQDNILLREDFNDNSRKWSNFSNDNASASVENGVYKIRQIRQSGSWHFYTSQFMDPKNDYYIEAKITQSGGVENYGYGIVWASRDYDDYNVFSISTNGYFKVYGSRDGKSTEAVGWTKTELVKPLGQANVLAIRKTDRLFTFYVNGVEVFHSSNIRHFGSRLGFVLNQNMSAEVDYIEVHHPPISINLISNAINGYKKENLGRTVNTAYEELCPQISPDGKRIFFSRRSYPDNIGGTTAGDDIYYSELDKDGHWGMATNVGSPLNNAGHNFVVTVSPDGNSLLVGNTYNADGTSKGIGVSVSYRTETGWTVPEEQKIKNFYNRNTYVGNFLSADKKVLISTVERDDSYGEKDLYVCFIGEDGEWTEPKNMGPVVNSFEEEMTPFLAADNTSLYFSTAGKPGYGSADIFVSRRLDDTWTNWSEPQNLGPEVNSSDWDAYYSISARGDYAYLVSQNNSIGKGDIFRIKLAEGARPKPVVLVYGKVLNSKTNQPIGTDIKYYDLSSNQEVGVATSNPQDGSYKIVLPSGRNYGFLAAEEGYYSISENMKVMHIDKYTEIERNLLLAPLETGTVIRLNNLFFDTDKSDLKKESSGELDRLVRLLNSNPRMVIEIGGHTDDIGAADYNQKLSEDRVNAVITYLKSKNIGTERLVGKGYGKTKPLASNSSEEGRAKNRRVEFTIKSM